MLRLKHQFDPLREWQTEQANIIQDPTSDSTQSTNGVDAPSVPVEDATNSDQTQGATNTQTVLGQPDPTEAGIMDAFKEPPESR